MKNLVPWGPSPHKWNKIFLCCAVIAVFLDTLFFYVPVIDGSQKCLSLDKQLEITACVLRSITDIFYILHLFFQFYNGITSYFIIIDILAALPLPQVAVLVIIPNLNGPVSLITKDLLKFVIFFQYVPRSIQISMLYKEMTSTARIFTEIAWAGAALNLVLYILASHVVGVLWYAFTIEREVGCWRDAYEKDNHDYKYLYCGKDRVGHYAFLDSSCPHLEPNAIKHSTDFDFGIFLEALQSNVVEARQYPQKFFYCSWWGLRSLSSLGQNLRTSTYVWEILFAYFISILGLILFSLLIGNMQKCLHSYYRLTRRAEEMIERRRDAEQFMSRCNLPPELRGQIRQYEQYRWKKTRGVELDHFMHKLPRNQRRAVKVHLCLDLMKRVPICKGMDQQLLEAICDHLKPVLYTAQCIITREGQQVDEMLFIKQGKLESSISTNYGNDSYLLKDGDFCGEELLSWALYNPSSILPTSTRRIQALTNVEAFALMNNDWKFVASHFHLIHNKQLIQNFRYYSLESRRAACFIQAEWRKYLKRKSLQLQEAIGRKNLTKKIC